MSWQVRNQKMTEEREPLLNLLALSDMERFAAGTPRLNVHMMNSSSSVINLLAVAFHWIMMTFIGSFSGTFPAPLIVFSQTPPAASLSFIKFPEVVEPAKVSIIVPYKVNT